ncbi:MAG TPA: GGDEF domain-containing protein [Pseudomonadota bacterium]|jgi:diguanylate cyclase (GGDEF)-like protein|nr:GGDEF domain-containing protein [Pseudomonadota bacterium]HNI59027.1 GGDEF domain-containing protein [Pseudomonadota bacterium]HNK44361.1 GGDEF domain-containing protein [Pseudomonadota bacterium]HNN51103.1 GGDEF domain-containing protein [Pseudomonadota bacterium]HNO67170.1 GGDEF domain-containing protein [Pseudomonadota bacterium]
MDQDKSRKNRADAVGRGPLLLLTYAGALEAPETGRRFILDGEEIIIGRSSDATIQVDRDSVSRRHARLSKTEGGWTVQDLQSTNGSYVNDVPIREHKLASGDLLKVGSAIFRYLAGNNLESLLTDELYQIAVRDGLTHSLSRRAFVEAADREVARAHKQSRPLSLLAIDIDHVKQINDNYGHLSGDFVIRELARRIRKKCERYELLCRYEGSQFLLLLPESNQQAAQARAEEIRASAASESFSFEGDQLAVTVTVGVLTLSPEGDTVSLLRQSQEIVQRGKKQGRNRVVS